MFTEVIFDIETKTFFDESGDYDASKLGVSIVSLYSRHLKNDLEEIEGELLSFWESDFKKMWSLFSSADRIIGFNSKRFDVPALKPYAPPNFARLPHFDILEEVKKASGKRASLNKIATQTLQKEKNDNPANAILYFQKGDKESLEKLKRYCEEDVRLTKEIYDFVLKNKYLEFKDFWNEERVVSLDFSYLPASQESSQTSLF